MKAIEKLRSLPIAERIQLVEDLWDSIAEDSGETDFMGLVRQFPWSNPPP